METVDDAYSTTINWRDQDNNKDVQHIWANTVCISGALLGYNMLSVIQQQLGKGQLKRIFFSPLAPEAEVDQ
jgi:hypothetical protein